MGYKSEFAFLRRMPLYGSTDAPLRRYATSAKHIRKCGYRPHKEDLRCFSKRRGEPPQLSAMLIIHLDDIIMRGLGCAIQKSSECLAAFKHGEIQLAGESVPLTYFGLNISRKGFPCGSVSQDDFRENVCLMSKEEVDGAKATLKTAESLRKSDNVMIGGLILLLQSGYDV